MEKLGGLFGEYHEKSVFSGEYEKNLKKVLDCCKLVVSRLITMCDEGSIGGELKNLGNKYQSIFDSDIKKISDTREEFNRMCENIQKFLKEFSEMFNKEVIPGKKGENEVNDALFEIAFELNECFGELNRSKKAYINNFPAAGYDFFWGSFNPLKITSDFINSKKLSKEHIGPIKDGNKNLSIFVYNPLLNLINEEFELLLGKLEENEKMKKEDFDEKFKHLFIAKYLGITTYEDFCSSYDILKKKQEKLYEIKEEIGKIFDDEGNLKSDVNFENLRLISLKSFLESSEQGCSLKEGIKQYVTSITRRLESIFVASAQRKMDQEIQRKLVNIYNELCKGLSKFLDIDEKNKSAENQQIGSELNDECRQDLKTELRKVIENNKLDFNGENYDGCGESIGKFLSELSKVFEDVVKEGEKEGERKLVGDFVELILKTYDSFVDSDNFVGSGDDNMVDDRSMSESLYLVKREYKETIKKFFIPVYRVLLNFFDEELEKTLGKPGENKDIVPKSDFENNAELLEKYGLYEKYCKFILTGSMEGDNPIVMDILGFKSCEEFYGKYNKLKKIQLEIRELKKEVNVCFDGDGKLKDEEFSELKMKNLRKLLNTTSSWEVVKDCFKSLCECLGKRYEGGRKPDNERAFEKRVGQKQHKPKD